MNNITTDPNLWAICGLVFVLGLLIGIFLTAGGRRKWRTRYDSEVARRRDLEKTHDERASRLSRRSRFDGSASLTVTLSKKMSIG